MSEHLIKTTKREKVRKFAIYYFNQEELLDIGKNVGRKVQESKALEDQKKAVTSDFKARIDSVDAEINLMSTHLQTGFCHKDYECYLVRNYTTHTREYWDVNTSELITTEKLTPEDYQMKLDLEESEKKNQPADDVVVPVLAADANASDNNAQADEEEQEEEYDEPTEEDTQE